MNVRRGLVKLTCWLALVVAATAGWAQKPANAISCSPTFQPLRSIPQLVSTGGVLKGTLYTVSEQVRMTARSGGLGSDPYCFPQWVRAYRLSAPSSWNPPSSQISEPIPGPVLRARVGEMVELTFLNAIDANKFPGVDDGKCDATSEYPGTGANADKEPDCFSGSVYTNIHYHGTHTNPNSTGDNVFLQIRPSPRKTDGTNTPVITAGSVQPAFDEFFKQCEGELLANNGPKVWPRFWKDLTPAVQSALLDPVKQYAPAWYTTDQTQISEGLWPQYYVGAYPYCFKLPQYTQTAWPPSTQAAMQSPHSHGQGQSEMDEAQEPQRPLVMGQAPGTHWYHAHKHGSTTINVLNGMTGVFIIEGQYDDDINAVYGANWTRTQPVLVINQLGSAPPLQSGQRGAGPGPDFSVNGQLRPVISMKGGEVQLWRIANTSSRSGAMFLAPNGLQWMQLAQDGVQFNNVNYQASRNQPFLMASGNRVDLLVKAPPFNAAKGANNTYDVMVYNTVDPSDHPPANTTLSPAQGVILLRVVVTGGGANMDFMTQAPAFPPFLADITSSEVQGTQTLTFASSPNPSRANPSAHTINGKKFNGDVGASVTLNQVQEWKVVNATYPPANLNQISHPFHIHINPFQIFELFDPNDTLSTKAGTGTVTTTSKSSTVTGTGTSFTTDFVVGDFIWIAGEPPGTVASIASDTSLTVNYSANGVSNASYTAVVPLYTVNPGTARPNQCVLDPNNQDTWHPCRNDIPQTNAIWWDVFPIPSGNIFYSTNGTQTSIPGYFKMRSRFVDYYGDYVMHCHILAHEDRGMMTVVRVVPLQSPMSHH